MKYDTVSVKVMRSYDYCHFEVQLGKNIHDRFIKNGDQELLITEDKILRSEVDEMRKDAARLVDKAVDQYKIKMQSINREEDFARSLRRLKSLASKFIDTKPKDWWSPEQKAIVKKIGDIEHALSVGYYYQSDYEVPDFENDDISF